jgi:hypothetical protein
MKRSRREFGSMSNKQEHRPGSGRSKDSSR